MGLVAEILLDEREMSLVDIEDWDERAEATDDGGVGRGVEMSGVDGVLFADDAIARVGVLGGGGGEEERDLRGGRG